MRATTGPNCSNTLAKTALASRPGCSLFPCFPVRAQPPRHRGALGVPRRRGQRALTRIAPDTTLSLADQEPQSPDPSQTK